MGAVDHERKLKYEKKIQVTRYAMEYCVGQDGKVGITYNGIPVS